MNKSKLIRETKKAHPEMGPTAMVEYLAKNNGVRVSTAFVSTVLTQARKRKNYDRPGRPAQPKLDIDGLMRVKRLVDEFGGVKQLRKAIDAIEMFSS